MTGFSLNEIAATAKKAARGAGYPWGIAEEAAQATPWLCGLHLGGCRALAGLLAQIDGRNVIDHTPQKTDGIWTARGGWLCPLMAGACLSDSAMRLRDGPVEMAQVTRPLLLLPFAAAAARQLKQCLQITWPGQSVATDGTVLALEGTAGLTIPRAGEVKLRIGPMTGTPCTRRSRATPNAEDWEMLEALAARLYAPATEASRRLGAGADI